MMPWSQQATVEDAEESDSDGDEEEAEEDEEVAGEEDTPWTHSPFMNWSVHSCSGLGGGCCCTGRFEAVDCTTA